MGRTSADQTRDWRFATTLNSDPELAGNRHPESWEEVVHRDLGAPGYRHLVRPLQGLPPREARLRKVQEVADTRDLYLCLQPALTQHIVVYVETGPREYIAAGA